MKIALLGSTGYVGEEILKECIGQGHQVRVLVRHPEKLGPMASMVEVVEGDYCDPAKVAQTIAGAEIVLSAIGPTTKRPKNISEYTRSMVEAMNSFVAAIEREHIKKVVWLSGAATPLNVAEKFNARQKLIQFMLNATARYILDIKTKESQILSRSSLNWIMIRPPAITKGAPTGHVIADDHKLRGMKIDRADLVNFIMHQLITDKWLHKAPLVCSAKS